MYYCASYPHYVFFDGGAGVDLETLATQPEPADFDEFWAKQFKRLDLVPIKADRIDIPCENKGTRLYAIRIDCAGLRPVTGYLSIPKVVDEGKTFPCRLETHGYVPPPYEGRDFTREVD